MSARGIIDSARLTGHFRYVELVGFVRVGARARSATGPRLTSALFAASGAHGFRSRLLEEVLPVSGGLPSVAELTQSPNDDLEMIFSEALELPDDEVASALSNGIYTPMLRSYEASRRSCTPFGDPPLARTFDRALFDLERSIVDLGEVAKVTAAHVADIAERMHLVIGDFSDQG